MEETYSAIPVELLLICGACVLIVMSLLAGAVRIIPEEKRIQVRRLGRYIGEKGPGLVILIPYLDRGTIVDLQDRMDKAAKRIVFPGAAGEAVTPIHADGSVLIRGETWNAASKSPIAAGESVRVVRIVVEVERIVPL
jgi:membrane-bound ClpP family serine protease